MVPENKHWAVIFNRFQAVHFAALQDLTTELKPRSYKMKTEVLEKMAAQDAERWASAEMFYGEGAGTRRKLLDAELQTKYNMPGYYDAFCKAYDALDMNKFAEMAIKERKKLDRAASAGKNIRALKNGNMRGLSTGVFVVVGAAYLAHQTGYDKVLEEKARRLYQKAKIEVKVRKARMQGRNVEKIHFG